VVIRSGVLARGAEGRRVTIFVWLVACRRLAVAGPAGQRGNSEAFNGSYENHSTDEDLSAESGEESGSGQP
jgi:hypothetical protein